MHRLIGLIVMAATLPAAPPSAGSSDRDMAGWSRRVDAGIAAIPCTVELPRLPLRQAVTTMLQHPADLPRPTLRCDGVAGTAALPLAADPMLLERVEGAEPTLAWTPKLEVLSSSGGIIVVDVDVFPLRPAETARPISGPWGRVTAPAIRPYEPPRFRTDPSRPGSAEPDPTMLTVELVPPVLAVRRLEGIDADVLAVFSSGAWLAADLAVERGRLQWYRVSAAEYFGLPGRIVVAPTPRHPRAVLELLAIDPASAAVTSLGRPAARGATWRQELSDLRERNGSLEALVIVRDASARGDIDGPVFGAFLRLEAGAWKQVDTAPLPRTAEPRSLRFDAADPRALLLVAHRDGHEVTWSRRLP